MGTVDKTQEKEIKTYQHDEDDKEKVPYQVFLATHPGVASLQGAARVVEEICVKHQTELRAGDEKACYASPDLWWEPYQIITAVYERSHVQETQVHR